MISDNVVNAMFSFISIVIYALLSLIVVGIDFRKNFIKAVLISLLSITVVSCGIFLSQKHYIEYKYLYYASALIFFMMPPLLFTVSRSSLRISYFVVAIAALLFACKSTYYDKGF